LLAPGSPVAIDVSAGNITARRLKWWENTSSIFSILGAITLATLIIIFGSSSIHSNSPGIFEQLSQIDTARGVITFLIAFTTVGIAIILALSTVVLADSPENEKRFDRGKQVLTVLIGVLGTIVGFYFASGNKSSGEGSKPAITSTSLPNGIVGSKYGAQITVTGGTPPLKWTVKPGLPNGLTFIDGVIAGTPTEPSEGKEFTFVVTDAS